MPQNEYTGLHRAVRIGPRRLAAVILLGSVGLGAAVATLSAGTGPQATVAESALTLMLGHQPETRTLADTTASSGGASVPETLSGAEARVRSASRAANRA